MSVYEEVYGDLKDMNTYCKTLRVASELSYLIHCMKDKKVYDEEVLGRLVACRNSLWEEENKKNESSWHTGTPTEEGDYWIAFFYDNKYRYGKATYLKNKPSNMIDVFWDGEGFYSIGGLNMRFQDNEEHPIAWMPLIPYKEKCK